MNWIFLLLAGIFEVIWTTTMKLSNGFTIMKFNLLTIVSLILSMGFLAMAIKKLPLSIAYPVWTGIGAAGAIILGVVFFQDQIKPITWVFVAFLIIGIIGIKLTSD